MKVWFGAALTICAIGAGVLAGINPWLGLAPWALAGLLGLARLIAGPRDTNDARRGLDAGRDSWGGRAIVLLGASVVASAFLTRVVDGAVQRVDRTGERYLISSGEVGRTIGFFLVFAAVACAAVAISRNRRAIHVGSWYSRWMLALIAWWLACTLALRLEWASAWVWGESVAAGVLAAGVVAAPPTRRTLLNLTHLLNLTVVSLLAYGLANPGEQMPCGVDKCGIFGSLFTGYLFQENAAARLVVLLVPVAWVVRSSLYLTVTLAGAGVFVAATGSRTSLLSYLVAAAVVIALRWVDLRGTTEAVKVPRWLRVLPLMSLGAAVFVFLFVPASALTGRGGIWAGIREHLHGWALFVGSGPGTVDSLRLGFRPSGEHGQASHLLVYGGVPALLLFAAALCALLVGRRWSLLQASGFSLMLVAATQFATEVALPLETRSMPYALLLLSVGLLLRVERSLSDPLDPRLDVQVLSPRPGRRSARPPAAPVLQRTGPGTRPGPPPRG